MYSMKEPGKAVLLRIFIGEEDRDGKRPLYETIVKKARELNLAGATVLRGILGFGADSRMHAARLLTLSDNLPVIIEIADTRKNIEKLLPFLDEHVSEGFVTMEDIEVIRYREK